MVEALWYEIKLLGNVSQSTYHAAHRGQIGWAVALLDQAGRPAR